MNSLYPEYRDETLVEAAADAEEGEASSESSEYMRTPRLICRKLFRQVTRFALLLTVLRAGNNKAARMAMMAMMTNSSIRVNPCVNLELNFTPVQTMQ